MSKTKAVFLTLAIIATSFVQSLSAETDPAQQSTATVKAEMDTLPPVGEGLDMVKPYQTRSPVQDLRGPEQGRVNSTGRVQKPLSREIVPPGYRYGSPGYIPDGRGGRGYDYGYPGYRDQGGGGYPHRRGW